MGVSTFSEVTPTAERSLEDVCCKWSASKGELGTGTAFQNHVERKEGNESMANPEQNDEPSKESERSRWCQRENRVFVIEAKVGESFKPNVKKSLEVNPKCLVL